MGMVWLSDRGEAWVKKLFKPVRRCADAMERIADAVEEPAESRQKRGEPSFKEWVIAEIDQFEKACQEKGYTDTGEVWEYLNTFRMQARNEMSDKEK